MDIIGFIATLIGLITNPFGFVDAARDAAGTAVNLADEAQFRLREWLGRTLARPMRNLMWACCVGLSLITVLVTVLQFSVLTAAERQEGIFTVFLGVSLASIIGVAFFAWRQGSFVIGRPVIAQNIADQTDVHDDEPIRVSFFWSGAVLTLAMAAISVTLSLHALWTKSSSLWLVSMVTRYLGLLVIAVVMTVIAWLVRRGGGLVERLLQFGIELLAPIAPGITYANVRQRLFPNGLNLFDEEEDAVRIAGITAAIASALIPFDLVVWAYTDTDVAVVFGGAYLFKLIAGWLAIRCDREDLVIASRRRFAGILFTYGPWVAALSFGAWRVIRAGAPALAKSISGRTGIWVDGLVDFWQGRVYLVDNHSLWWSIPLLFVFTFITMGAIGAVSHWDSRKWKVIGIAVPALAVVWCAIAIKVRLSDEQGWTPFSANVAQTDAQQIGVNNLQSKVTDTSVLLTWETGKDARCRVEIKEIRDRNGRPVDRATGIPLVVFDPSEEPKKPSEINEEMQEQATAALGKRVFLEAVSLEDGHIKHRVAINNLAYGWTVVYRVWTKHIADPDTGMWPDQDPPWHNVSVIAPASAPAAAPSTAPKTAPSNVPAAQSAPPKDRPAAATNSGASQKLADSRRLLEGL